MTQNPSGSPGNHPDLLRIDAVRAGEGTQEDRSHLEVCAACRETLEQMRRTAGTLKELQPTPPEIPAEVDRALLQAFRKQDRPQGKEIPFPAWRRWGLPVGAAVAAVLVLAVVLPSIRPPEPIAERAAQKGVPASLALAPTAPAWDVNSDGQMDILDAYQLAFKLEQGQTVAQWDTDGDGTVNRSDVDTLARRAVSLM